MAENEKRIVVSGISLRRDVEAKYELVAAKFIPKKGEVCLVDTEKKGLCAIVGDGVSTYAQLEEEGYVNNIFVVCYYYNGKFYADENHTKLLSGIENKFYVDKNNLSNIYYYLDGSFIKVGADIPVASVETAGIMKLYNTKGNNTDGTVTQSLFTNEINQKIEATVKTDEELVIFDCDL